MVATDEDERCVEVLVVLPCIITVEFFRFPSVCGKKVCAGIVCPEGLKEVFEGGTEARVPVKLSI